MANEPISAHQYHVKHDVILNSDYVANKRAPTIVSPVLLNKEQQTHNDDEMMMSYQNPPSIGEEETTDVPLGTTILEPTMTSTMDHHSKRMVAIIAGLILLVAGGAVWLQDGSSYTTAAEGLVIGTHGPAPCLPAGGAFSGISDTHVQRGQPFETCFQLGDEAKYCWSKSYVNDDGDFYQCHPNPKGGTWKELDPQYVNTPGVDSNTNPKRCGPPCQDMYQG